MAAETARGASRPAIWPWLLMPLIILLVFCALYRVHQHSRGPTVANAPAVTNTPGE